MLLPLALFCANGLSRAWRTPRFVQGPAPAGIRDPRELRVLALNAAKCWFHEDGLSFASADAVNRNLDAIAASIAQEHPDIVFLSEVVMDSGPVPIDQVEALARRCGFANFASGENYSFGLPFLRITSGNAVLSNLPLRAPSVMQLAGGRPFWNPTNNRRVLWCEAEVRGEWILCASIRNDSFDLENNLVQVREILTSIGERPALLAGDFNAQPNSAPMTEILATGRFIGMAEGPPTFPAESPTRRIDQILGPSTWTVATQSIVDTRVSDHLAVATVFELPDVSAATRWR